MRNWSVNILFILFITLFPLHLRAQTVGESTIGVPFFRNFSATEYKAHNRNFDVVCDKGGRVFIANFEGLLVYDGEEWEVMHTPGISRVTSLYIDKNDHVWFGGNNVLGYVNVADSIRPVFVTDENNKKLRFGEVHNIFEENGKLVFTTSSGSAYSYANGQVKFIRDFYEDTDRQEFWNGVEINDQLTIKDMGLKVYATANKGVIATDLQGNKVYNITYDNGLCSDAITSLAYDGRGSVWGTTDNGVFLINTSTVYTYFSEEEGLKGQVTSLLIWNGKLLAGTLQGLFVYDNGVFRNMQDGDQACWHINSLSDSYALASTAEGVFSIDKAFKSHALSTKHTLSTFIEDENTFLMGAIDGIYRHSTGSGDVLLDKIQNVVKFVSDNNGGVWALTLYNETYYMPRGGSHFQKKQNNDINLMLSYTDAKGVKWSVKNNGMGLTCEGKTKEMEAWLHPFDDCIIQSMVVDNNVAWLGGAFGIYCFDFTHCKHTLPTQPKIDIRYFVKEDRYVNFCVANEAIQLLGKTLYSYRLNDNEEWSKWREDQDVDFDNMSYGSYKLTVRLMDAFGQISESEPKSFEIPYPIYMRWYFVLLYIILIAFIIYAIFRYRMHRLEKERQQLEQVVKERTLEVVKQKDEIEQKSLRLEAQKDEIEAQKNEIESQKDEIEQKSHALEDTLEELRSAQQQLIRKEREATVGKLTKGLIDRILNPMNYINNFSHLTIGLTKDLKENIEDEEDKMEPDNFDDCMDVLDMMKTNLEKIEQHGISTTRTLKAMEEMLKERSDKVESLDISLICQQNIEMLNNYFKDDIAKYGISIEWNRPAMPIVADVNADLLSRTFMSMLANSIYAVKKKAEKLGTGTYKPVVSLSICPKSGEEAPNIVFYDNGIGIEQSIIDKIFDPFFTTKPTAEAPGVGLYLGQQIIQDFGGTISVKSVKDEYTEFTISLP